LAYIAVGTGVGSGLILNGQLVRGAANAAGEIGFMPFGADPYEPESLRMGAFERVVASHGIVARYKTLTGREETVRTIFGRLADADAEALQVLDETARLLAQGVAAIASLTNPGKVILGGSIGERPELVSRVRDVLPLCFPYPVPVEAGALGAHAALVGAAALGL